MDCSLQVSSVHGVSQARTLEWVAISFSRESSQPRDWTFISCTAGGFFTIEQPEKPIVNNTALYRLKIAKRVDHKISQLTHIHIMWSMGELTDLIMSSFTTFMVYQVMLYTLNLYNVLCQFYFNKAEEKNDRV